MADYATVPQEIIDELVGNSHGNLARVQELVAQYPAAITASAAWVETPIQAAAQMGRRDIADVLLAAGAPLDICTAAVFGMADEVDAFLVADPDAPQATGAHGIPLLYYPVIGGHKEIAAKLLAAGAPIDAGAGGTTPLHGAAMFGQAELAEWLLQRGAAPNPLNYENKTPLRVAIDGGKEDVAAILRQYGGTE